MKNILLLATLLLFNIAFGQNKPINSFPKNSNTPSMPNEFGQFDPRQDPFLFFSTTDQERDIQTQEGELFDLIQQNDSVYLWQWDVAIGGWQVESKYVYTLYNVDNFPLSFSLLKWNGTEWLNVNQYTYTYDENNNRTGFIEKFWTGTSWENDFQSLSTYYDMDSVTQVTQVWNGTEWENSDRQFFIYDGNHNLISYTLQTWDLGWLLYIHITYTYDTNNNLTSKIYEGPQGVDWFNSYQYINSYDGDNNLIFIIDQRWNGTSWDNDFIYTYTYDSNKNRIGYVAQSWDGTYWVNYSKGASIYNASNNLTYELNQFWNGAGWDNSYRYILTYDGNNLIKVLNEAWNGFKWVKSRIYYYTYDENNFNVGKSFRDYNEAGDAVTYGDSTHYYFHTVTDIEDLIADESNIIVHPNPSNGKFTVSSPRPLGAIEIYDMNGKKVFESGSAFDQTSRDIDLTRYGTGVYIIKLNDGIKTIGRKVVVQ